MRLRAVDLLIVFFAVAIVHGASTLGKARLSPDSQLYIAMAGDMHAHGWAAPVQRNVVSSARWMRLALPALIAASQSVAGEHWPILIVAINVLADASLATMLFAVASWLTASRIFAFIAALLYLGSFEVFMWVRYVLTDPIFAALAFVPFMLIVRNILRRTCTAGNVIAIGVATFAALLARPTGVFIAAVAAIGIWIMYRVSRGRPVALTRGAIAAVAFAAIVFIVVVLAVMNDPSLWPLPWMRNGITSMSTEFHRGRVVIDRPETYLVPHSFAGIVAVFAARVVRFFQFAARGHSRVHNIVNFVYFLPLYVFALIGVATAGRVRDERVRVGIVFTAIWVGAIALFHGLTLVDFDWRYRLPVMPQLILLAVAGLQAVSSRLSNQAK